MAKEREIREACGRYARLTAWGVERWAPPVGYWYRLYVAR